MTLAAGALLRAVAEVLLDIWNDCNQLSRPFYDATNDGPFNQANIKMAVGEYALAL